MHSETELPHRSRMFIVLVAVLQGGLMYLAQKGHELGWWPFAALGGRVCWYTLVLTVPTVMALSVVCLRDVRFWQHAGVLAALFLALAAWAGWNASGAPGLHAGAVLAPFGVTVALAAFVLLPWLQCRLAHGRWRAPYPELFEHAWQNALTLALAALFTGICWMVLQLWAGLFALVEISFFRDLFREDAFIHLATGAMAGLGILIGRTRQRAIQVARQILFAIFKGLLPLLAFIALLFMASLPFTGLQPLWETRSAAALLVSVVALLVLFLNAVYQDGGDRPPYPAWLRRVVQAALVVLPVYALLALVALGLRIGQYGWTADRVWAALASVLVTAYAFGYAWSALRGGDWLRPLPTVNRALSWAVVAVALLANTPLLDPHRIAVASQLDRLDDGRTSAAEVDLAYLRFESGRRGYRAARSLREHPAFTASQADMETLEEVLARPGRWSSGPSAADEPLDVEGLRAHVDIASGSVVPGDAWWEALARGGDCRGDSPCILLTPDLDADGRHEVLLCQVNWPSGGNCTLFARSDDGAWMHAARTILRASNQDNRRELLDDLRAGRVTAVPRRWPDLRIGDGARHSLAPVEDD
ncbi:MAG: DUF4153 domain-containing protein [Luteimonas sp.]